MGFQSATSSRSEANGALGWTSSTYRLGPSPVAVEQAGEHCIGVGHRGVEDGLDRLTDGAGFLLPLPDDDHMARWDARGEKRARE
jgi:hypothetical protein